MCKVFLNLLTVFVSKHMEQMRSDEESLVRRFQKGEEKALHKHPGIVGYHDPATRHRDEMERHPKGQLFPHYEKNSDGKWEYIK